MMVGACLCARARRFFVRSKYKKSYPRDILDYFRSFIGYWDGRLEALEARLAAEAWQKRAEDLAERQMRAVEEGKAFNEDVALMLDPESIKQGARIAAYEALTAEMTAKRRLQGLPELCKWAKTVGVTTQTVRNWCEEHEEFREAVEECMEIQAALLKDGGLSGVYAGKTAIFLLQTVHRMRSEGDEADSLGGMQVVIGERAAKEDGGGEVKTTDD
jgi:hypothetical protein